MKLTPEQQKALEEAMQERFPRTDMPTLPGEEAAFLAGCRYQHAATLERAAKVCDGITARALAAQTGKLDMNESVDRTLRLMALPPADCAAAIRALPYETKDE